MPIASQIAEAAHSFHMNSSLLKKSFEGLTTEEWLRRPGDCSNHLLWVVCHMVWARGNALRLLGTQWSAPWASLFGRGTEVTDGAQYPTPEEAVQAFREAGRLLKTAFDEVSEEALSAPSEVKVPSADNTLGGVINFFAYHDTYHTGQVAFLRCWLGHSGVAG
ncbi:MAG: DinB family protein [Terracidiphilus sp.]